MDRIGVTTVPPLDCANYDHACYGVPEAHKTQQDKIALITVLALKYKLCLNANNVNR